VGSNSRIKHRYVCACYCHFDVCLSVHAVNIASVCPFSLVSLVAYGPHDYPHFPAPPAKKAALSKQAHIRTESSQHSAVPNEAGFSDSAAVIPQCLLPMTQQMSLARQQMDSLTQSTWHSHVSVDCGKFSPLFVMMLSITVSY